VRSSRRHSQSSAGENWTRDTGGPEIRFRCVRRLIRIQTRLIRGAELVPTMGVLGWILVVVVVVVVLFWIGIIH
jgi:hypothetical protein